MEKKQPSSVHHADKNSTGLAEATLAYQADDPAMDACDSPVEENNTSSCSSADSECEDGTGSEELES